MDLSNKSLALMLLAAIVISLGSTVITLDKLSGVSFGSGQKISGKVPGWTAVNITQQVQCNIDKDVYFGSSGNGLFELNTHIDNSGNGFSDCTASASDNCSGMEINNTGNVNLNVNFSSNQDATAFLGGPSVVAADFQFNMTNGTQPGVPTQPGCENITGSSGWGAAWVTITTGTEFLVCDNLTFTDVNDIINIEYRVQVRPDTTAGMKNATITVNCNQI